MFTIMFTMQYNWKHLIISYYNPQETFSIIMHRKYDFPQYTLHTAIKLSVMCIDRNLTLNQSIHIKVQIKYAICIDFKSV